MDELRHPIQVVVRRTGLTADVLRAWERRYGAVEPTRTPTGRRLYSDGDVRRLIMLRRATEGGRSIGQIAALSDKELAALVAEDDAAAVEQEPLTPRGANAVEAAGADVRAFLDASLKAVRDLNGQELSEALARASLVLSPTALNERLIVPLMEYIGDEWRGGNLRIIHEHLATASIRSFLGEFNRQAAGSTDAPVIVVATPSGQVHELGAMLAATTAAAEGWRVVYLGTDLPAEEIASAAIQSGARVVAISVVYPADDPAMGDELLKVRRLTPESVAILVGGRSAAAYTSVIAGTRMVRLNDLPSLRATLEALRNTVNAA